MRPGNRYLPDQLVELCAASGNSGVPTEDVLRAMSASVMGTIVSVLH